MKKLFALLLTLVMLLPLFSTAMASETVEIRAAWWGDTKRFELYNSIVAEFMKANPGVQMSLSGGGSGISGGVLAGGTCVHRVSPKV